MSGYDFTSIDDILLYCNASLKIENVLFHQLKMISCKIIQIYKIVNNLYYLYLSLFHVKERINVY